MNITKYFSRPKVLVITGSLLLCALIPAFFFLLPHQNPYADMKPVFSSFTADFSYPPPDPLTGPWKIAVQPGHWKISELPDELIRLRTSTGAAYGNLTEAELVKRIAEVLVEKLNKEGYQAFLVPATVPEGLRADAFISIHADAGPPDKQGWKLAHFWRTSRAGLDLTEALSESFRDDPKLLEDSQNITVQMRGYFPFNYIWFRHAVSPYTPAVILELGYITNSTDRESLRDNPGYWADKIQAGLAKYFKNRPRGKVSDLATQLYSLN